MLQAARRKLNEEKALLKEEKEREIKDWENDVLIGEANQVILRYSWELPALTHFLCLTKELFNLVEVPVYTIERMLLMPRESRNLAYLMTALFW